MPRGHSKNIKPEVEKAILSVVAEHPHWSDQRSFDYLKRNYDKYNIRKDNIPGRRSIYNVRNRNGNPKKIENYRRHLKQDSPWSLGADIIIPDQIATEIIEIQHRLFEYDRYLTIRVVKWIIKLTPFIKPILNKKYPDEVVQNRMKLFQIASLYNRREQETVFNKEKSVITEDLDRKFIYEENVSVETYLHEWTDAFLESILMLEKDLSEDEMLTEEEIKKMLAKYDKGQVNKFYEWVYLKLNKQELKAEVYLEEHLEIKPVVEDWTVMNTRHTIAKWFAYVRGKYEKGGEK